MTTHSHGQAQRCDTRCPANEKMTLSAQESDLNTLYICCAIQNHPFEFQKDGAVALNHMLQKRAGFTKEEAFKVIGDALKSGLIRLDKLPRQGSQPARKRLVVSHEAFRPFRDRMIHKISQVQSEVVTFNWHMFRPRLLTEEERQSAKTVMAKGTIKDVKATLGDRIGKGVRAALEEIGDEENVRNPFDSEKKEFAETLSKAIRRFCSGMVGKDFVLIITRSGDEIVPAMKVIEREVTNQVDF